MRDARYAAFDARRRRIFMPVCVCRRLFDDAHAIDAPPMIREDCRHGTLLPAAACF